MRVYSIIASSACYLGLGLADLLTATPVALDPTITPAPDVPLELLKRQNNARFIGWISFSGEWTSRTCDVGGTYYQSGEYWRCCATTLNGCNIPVGCAAGSLIYSITTSGTSKLTSVDCTSVYTADPSFTICNTGFMYENSADSDAQTNVFCGVSSLNWSYYREAPASATSTSTSTTRSKITPSTTTTVTSSASTTPTDPFIIESSNPTSESQNSPSKAWIAGAVVGPLIGLALIGALIWFFFLRKKKSTPPPQPPVQNSQPNMSASYPAPGHPGSHVQYYDPQKQSNTVPVGVASHNSWAGPPPQSPISQASTSPHPQQVPFGPPQGQQQWQPMPQGQQVYSPSQSPPPQQGMPMQNGQVYQQTGAGPRRFSSEMDGTTHYQTVGGATMPQQGQVQYPR